MSDITIVLDQTGEQALACDICDEALEAAAGMIERAATRFSSALL